MDVMDDWIMNWILYNIDYYCHINIYIYINIWLMMDYLIAIQIQQVLD